MLPHQAHNFHATFKYIHDRCGQLDGGKLLQQQIKLSQRVAAKQLVNQADITAQKNDNGNSISDLQAFVSLTCPSHNVDGGDTLKFSDFPFRINNVTTAAPPKAMKHPLTIL